MDVTPPGRYLKQKWIINPIETWNRITTLKDIKDLLKKKTTEQFGGLFICRNNDLLFHIPT